VARDDRLVPRQSRDTALGVPRRSQTTLNPPPVRPLFLAVFIVGLVLGVVSMIGGIDQNHRRGAWVKYVNLPTAGVAAALFGVVGYPLATYTNLGTAPILAIAGIAAAAGAAATVGVIAGWAVPSSRRESVDERYLLQGHLAKVVRAIRTDEEGGEISYEHDGARHTVMARSLDGKAISAGVDVVIERIENAIAYVELWSTIERELKLPS